MIPNRSEWKSWSALEKATYIAQLAASLALLPTVLFAFLGWREARLARADQAEFFLAEKAPHIEVSDVVISGGILTIELSNSGESLARDIRLVMLVVNPKTAEVSKLALMPAFESIPISVSKGHKFAMPIMSNIELEKVLGYVPSQIRLYDMKTVETSGPPAPVLNVVVEYNDIRLRSYVAAATAKLQK